MYHVNIRGTWVKRYGNSQNLTLFKMIPKEKFFLSLQTDLAHQA